jgi:hypothetical protein
MRGMGLMGLSGEAASHDSPVVVEPTRKIDRTGPKYALIVPRFQHYTVIWFRFLGLAKPHPRLYLKRSFAAETHRFVAVSICVNLRPSAVLPYFVCIRDPIRVPSRSGSDGRYPWCVSESFLAKFAV